MRKWYVPVTLLGLGGLAVFALSERGRRYTRWAMEYLPSAPDKFLEWNEAAQRELDRLQTALNQVAETLDGVRTAH